MKHLKELSTKDLVELNGGLINKPWFTIPSLLEPMYPICPPWEILIQPTKIRRGK